MKVRPIDENGDMMPVQSADQLLEGAPAVGQLVRERMAFLYGEWWEDETLGFRVPEFMIEGVRHGQIGMLEQYISQYVAGTAGVAVVRDVEATFADHKLTYSCTADAGDGSEEVEVDLSGLL